MKPEVHERIAELCARIQTETDDLTFTQLVRELNRLLDEAEPRSKLAIDRNPSTISAA